MKTIANVPAKEIQGFQVSMTHFTEKRVSADPRCGEFTFKGTLLIINGVEMCTIQGFEKNHNNAFETARAFSRGKKWEF